MMNRSRQWLCALLAGLVTTGAATTATAKSVRVSRVPTATLADAAMANAAPKQISKSSRVDGIFVAHPPARWQNKENPTAAITSSKEAAREFSKGEFSNFEADESQACFTAVAPFNFMHRENDEFPSEQASMQQIWSGSQKSGRVWLVRSERFIRGAKGSATLHVTDAYVDAVSLGAKLVAKSTVELTRVAQGPSKIEVYAARDGERIQFVVAAADRAGIPKDSRSMLGSLRLASSNESGFSQCGFLRTTMAAEGGGRSTTVFTHVPLEFEAADPDHRTFRQGEVLLREAAVHLSVTHSSTDRLPVVSVAFGWEGDSRRVEL